MAGTLTAKGFIKDQPRILFIYIVWELIFPFVLASGVISAILLMDQIYKFIPFLQAAGLDFGLLLQMLLYSLPTILMIATPIGLMIGVYVGVHRISADYELIAMRAAGISLSFVLKPVLFVAFIVSLFVMLQTFYLSPMGVTSMEELKFNILKQQTRVNLSVGKINNFFNQKMIYIFEREEEFFHGIFIADWNTSENNPVIEAKRGAIEFDEISKKILFLLYDGKIHYPQDKGHYQIVHFDRLDYNLTPPEVDRSNLPNRFRNPDGEKSLMDIEMTQGELVRQIELSKDDRSTNLKYRDEYHGRIVTILSCFSFAIFAVPMGIYDPRNPKTSRFIYMIIMMIVYYSFFSKARSMMIQGKAIPPALYFPLVLAVGIGLVNFFKINYDLKSIREWFQLKKTHKK